MKNKTFINYWLYSPLGVCLASAYDSFSPIDLAVILASGGITALAALLLRSKAPGNATLGGKL